MGKNKKNKKATVISLNDFNADSGVPTGDPALAALPSAPRGEEAWASEGIETHGRFAGRPRLDLDDGGFKSRNALDDEEFAERDWTRRMPPAGADGPDRDGGGFVSGAGADDEAWGAARRGPLGPLDAAGQGGFGSGFAPSDSDWATARRGPLPAVDGGPGPVQDADWSSARRGPMPPRDGGPVGPVGPDADGWANARRGPLPPPAGSGQLGSAGPDADGWASARTGPLPPAPGDNPLSNAELDWSARKGPVAVAPEVDDEAWAQARSGSGLAQVSATAPPRHEQDWGEARKKAPPVDPAAPPARSSGEDWDNARGARAPTPADATTARASQETPVDSDWTSVRGRAAAPAAKARDTQTADAADSKDWTNVRRGPPSSSQPKQAPPTTGAENNWRTVRSSSSGRTSKSVPAHPTEAAS